MMKMSLGDCFIRQNGKEMGRRKMNNLGDEGLLVKKKKNKVDGVLILFKKLLTRGPWSYIQLFEGHFLNTRFQQSKIIFNVK